MHYYSWQKARAAREKGYAVQNYRNFNLTWLITHCVLETLTFVVTKMETFHTFCFSPLSS